MADVGSVFHTNKGKWCRVEGARDGFHPFKVFGSITPIVACVGEVRYAWIELLAYMDQ